MKPQGSFLQPRTGKEGWQFLSLFLILRVEIRPVCVLPPQQRAVEAPLKCVGTRKTLALLLRKGRAGNPEPLEVR